MSVTGTVAQTLFKPTQTIRALEATVMGSVAQTLLKPTQAVTSSKAQTSDEFFSWRTD